MKKVFIKTFGCQMNEYDSNRIYDLISKIGYQKTNIKTEADCYVLNTCHIREKATEKVYDEIGRVKKNFKTSKKPLVIVSGCVAQAESGEIVEFVDDEIEKLQKIVAEKLGYQLVDHKLELYGIKKKK